METKNQITISGEVFEIKSHERQDKWMNYIILQTNEFVENHEGLKVNEVSYNTVLYISDTEPSIVKGESLFVKGAIYNYQQNHKESDVETLAMIVAENVTKEESRFEDVNIVKIQGTILQKTETPLEKMNILVYKVCTAKETENNISDTHTIEFYASKSEVCISRPGDLIEFLGRFRTRQTERGSKNYIHAVNAWALEKKQSIKSGLSV